MFRVAVGLALLLGLAAASEGRAELAVPPLERRVTDTAGVLPEELAATLERELSAFERETSHQIAVLTVATLDGEPIESFGLRVAEAWKLGGAEHDNGAILIVALDDRQARIEVGYGLEGVIPDAIAKRILEDEMFPHFRAEAAPLGVAAGARALMRAARGEVLPERPRSSPGAARAPEAPMHGVFLAAVLGGLVGRAFGGRGRRAWLGRGSSGLVAGGIGYLIVGSLLGGLLAAGLAALFASGAFPLLAMGRGGRMGGGFGGGFGGGGFGGGGGGFGGGGASGRW